MYTGLLNDKEQRWAACRQQAVDSFLDLAHFLESPEVRSRGAPVEGRVVAWLKEAAQQLKELECSDWEDSSKEVRHVVGYVVMGR